MNQAAKVQEAKGPLVWLDMDQKALDDAYDQMVYAPNRDQVHKRNMFNSDRVRARLGAPIGDFARPLLQSRHKRLMKLGLRYRTLPEPELHRLRILAKKMRYAAEAFHSLYKPKTTKKYLGSLAAIQDSLGSLNDAFVSRHLLSTLAQRLMVDRGMAAADANLLQGLVLGWQTARIDRDLGGLEQVWQNFAEEKRFWSGPKG